MRLLAPAIGTVGSTALFGMLAVGIRSVLRLLPQAAILTNSWWVAGFGGLAIAGNIAARPFRRIRSKAAGTSE